MKVIDAFTFFNEIDLLKFRLELLEDVVDYHVVCESNLTHSGKPKPYYLEERFKEFEKWKNKIIYFQIEQTTEGLYFDEVKSYSPLNGSWQLENQHRNSLAYAADLSSDEDIILIGDLDEIPLPEAIERLKQIPYNAFPISLSLLFHYYYMNCQNVGFEREWNGTVAVKGKLFKNDLPQTFRDNRNVYQRFLNAGYHWSYLGGVEKIRNKIESFAHTEFNRPEILSEENIVRSIENGEDIFNRPGVKYKFVGLEEYPEKVRNLMSKYSMFIKQL
jgi:beta-1,4-mannosyl-glycoprotein beta-1,4-N-acetylglucosaminyltransferase